MYNILIVDSSDEIREKIVSLHTPSVENVYLAKSIDELNDYIKNYDVDIIVSDLFLRDQELLPFFEEMRNAGYNLPVIILTTDQSRENVLKAASLGTMGYYLKPIEEGLLVLKIRTALEVYKEQHPSRNYVRVKPLESDAIELQYSDMKSKKKQDGKLIDISLGGLAFIRSSDDLCPDFQKGEIIDISLAIDSQHIKLICEVINILDMRCNVKFVDLPREYQEMLSSYIYRRIGVE